MELSERILELRGEGKSYREIRNLLKCSSATISFHCSLGQKEKVKERRKKRNAISTLISKVQRFRNRQISEKVRSFLRREESYLIPIEKYNFNYIDLLEKIGENPICYLSGKSINLNDPKSYHLDHVLPSTRGGKNTLENANVLDAIVNKMKHDLTVDEFIDKCKEILEFQGFEIRKKGE